MFHVSCRKVSRVRWVLKKLGLDYEYQRFGRGIGLRDSSDT